MVQRLERLHAAAVEFVLLWTSLYGCLSWQSAFARADDCPPVVFDCPQLKPLEHPAQNVYELKPQDIKVVMALGDSITAGFGMMGKQGGVLEDLQEYRGKSYSIGLDENSTTIAAFLRFYTPGIIGGSLGNHIGELCYGFLCIPFQYRPEQDVFNAAQSGAMALDFTHEFDYLYEEIKKNLNEDSMKNDWKLLTVLIGANDVCLGCSGDFPTLTADDFERNMREVLEKVRKNIPRVFVNLVLLGNISAVYDLSKLSPRCVDIHRVFPEECICAFLDGEEGDKLRREMDHLVAQYNERQMKIAKDYAMKRYDDFALVIQPFFSETTAADATIEFISSLDCFHPSLCAHQHMAKALWNNMFSVASQKITHLDFTKPFICPNETTLLYTY